jgi:hypothetical protein
VETRRIMSSKLISPYLKNKIKTKELEAWFK